MLLVASPVPKSKNLALFTIEVGSATTKIVAPVLKFEASDGADIYLDEPLKLMAGSPFIALVTNVG